MVALVGRCLIVAVLFVITACSAPENPDTRALPGADSDVSLEEALERFDIYLPPAVVNVRFGVFTGREESLKLRANLDCGSVDRVIVRSGIEKSRLRTGFTPSLVDNMLLTYDWEPAGNSILGGEHKSMDGRYVAILITRDSTTCEVYLAGFF